MKELLTKRYWLITWPFWLACIVLCLNFDFWEYIAIVIFVIGYDEMTSNLVNDKIKTIIKDIEDDQLKED